MAEAEVSADRLGAVERVRVEEAWNCRDVKAGDNTQTERRREVLLVGRAPTLIWALPYLMERCGFDVEVITTSALLRASRCVRELTVLASCEALSAVAYARICERARRYDWVVACDDQTLFELSGLRWPEGVEPAYLPLRTEGRRPHIYSKIGLSRVLQDAGVRTPPFRVVRGGAEAMGAARELGFPVLVKADAGSGGDGVFLCREKADLRSLEELFPSGPLLVQKKIEGREMDLSGVFFNGKLIHFTCSEIERQLGKSLSSVRRYWPLGLVHPRIMAELAVLGRALEANGFVSIGCIDAADGSGMYFFEADMRPNVWADISRLYGDDLAPKVRAWFEGGRELSVEDTYLRGGMQPVRLAHFQRVAWWELLVNRYGVWRTAPRAEWRLVTALVWARLYMPVARLLVPRGVRRLIKSGMVALRIAFP